MKKLICTLFVFVSFISVAQIEIHDSLLSRRLELGLNVMIIMPGEDVDGAQERPCGTVVTSVGTCCHRYQVICSGVVKWQSDLFCDNWCLYGVGGTILGPSSILIPTSSNPLSEAVDFDMSFIEEELDEEDILNLKMQYQNFYFEVQDDIVVNNGASSIIYQKGLYKIESGKMVVKYYFTN